MATTAATTTAETAETTICQICSDNSATSLEKIDAYIQERVVAAIDAEMKLRSLGNKRPAPPDQIIRFQDALGRKFSFPFALVKKWGGGMEHFITEAFQHVQLLNQLVRAGYYDLVSEGEVISSGEWETTVKPGIYVTMHMWPMEKVASEMRGPTSGVVIPLPARSPSPRVCSDSRSWVVKDCDDGVLEEEEEPKRKKLSAFRKLLRWMRDVSWGSGNYNHVTDERYLKIARLDLVHGKKTSDLGRGKEKC